MQMDYDVGKQFEAMHEKLDMLLVKLYPELAQKGKKP